MLSVLRRERTLGSAQTTHENTHPAYPGDAHYLTNS